MLYSWQINDYKKLVQSYDKQKFTALLLHGAAQSGRHELVKELVNYILCINPTNNQACNNCESCKLFNENNHPDYFALEAMQDDERKNKIIKVDQIQVVINLALKSTHIASKKIIYLPNANELNLNSANALLKIIEEPPKDCIFILLVKDINQIIPTILSRCFKYQLQIPDINQALPYIQNKDVDTDFWFKYFDNEPLFEAPLDSIQLNLLKTGLLKPSINNIFMLSRELDPKKIGADCWFDFLLKWLNDLVSLKLGNKCTYFEAKLLPKLADKVNLTKLFSLADELSFLYPWAGHPLNHKLQLENILFKYQQIFTNN